jgi:hypothetical protein
VRKLIVGGVSASALILAAIAFGATGASAAGVEGCLVQSGNNGAAVGNPVQSNAAPGAPGGSAPGATCAYQATTSGGWAGGGAVTIQYGPGTLATGATACTYTVTPQSFTNTSGPFSSTSSLPGALGPIKAGDCVSAQAG